jgi:hypothetical protein
VDAIEGVNMGNHNPKLDERARIFASWYDLPVTAGSDAHNADDKWFGGGIISNVRFKSADDYAREVKNNALAGLLGEVPSET